MKKRSTWRLTWSCSPAVITSRNERGGRSAELEEYRRRAEAASPAGERERWEGVILERIAAGETAAARRAAAMAAAEGVELDPELGRRLEAATRSDRTRDRQNGGARSR